MAEEIDVDWQEAAPVRGVGVCRYGHLKGRQFGVQLLSTQHGCRNAAQTACLENGSSQHVVLRSGHGRLDQSDLLSFKKRGVHDAIIPSLEAHRASLPCKS